MTRKNWIITGVLSIIIVLLCIGVYYVFFRGICIKVENRSANEISNINITYVGGKQNIPKIQTKNADFIYIHPAGASELTVDFIDSSNLRHVEKIDIYIERSYIGDVELIVNPDGKVVCKNFVSPF